MQIPLGTLELQYPVGQRDGSTLWSDSPAGSTEKFKGATSPSACQRRNHNRTIVNTAFSAFLALLLASYFCRSLRGLRGSDYRLLRRLASSDEDETCKDLLELIGNISRGDTGESSTSQERDQIAGPSRESVPRKRPRKRGPSRGSQDAGAKSAKKSLFEGAAQALGGDDHQSIDALPRPSSDQSSTQRQTDSFLEYQFSGGPHGPDEASAASVTEKFETAPHGTESAADADLIDAFLTEGDGIDQWFLDFILDPTSTSSAGSGLEDVKSTKELAGEVEAKTGDQVTPSSSSSSEGQSPAAPGSTSADALLPVFKTENVHDVQAGGSTDGRYNSASLQGNQAPLFLPRIATFDPTRLQVPSHDYSSAASSSIYQLLHFTPQHLTSTGPLDAPRPLHSQIPADEGALRHHPFYRLPRADCSHNLIPFSFSRATILTPQTRIPEVLTSIQTLLMKPHLGSDEVQSLMMLAEKLVKDVFCMGRFTKGFVRFWSLCESIMRRFIIADALWSICEVVGPSMRMQEWWGPVMDRLLVLPSAKVSFLQTQTDRFLIVRRLIAALHTYRAGRRPSASEVIALKREIFCSGNGPGSFRSPAYDMFRSIDGC